MSLILSLIKVDTESQCTNPNYLFLFIILGEMKRILFSVKRISCLIFIKMKENKTKLNDASVMDFLNSVENEKRKTDALLVLEMMERLTKEHSWRTV